jgi:ATP-dependent Clp protease ATP-binding subunit ClpX
MSAIHQLSRDELMQILTEPRNALVKQFQRFFQFDGIELVFADEALSSIADKALERETGARGLRSIIEEVLLEVQFELPSRRDVRKCVVTRDTIENGTSPTLVTVATPEEEAAEFVGAGLRPASVGPRCPSGHGSRGPRRVGAHPRLSGR